MLSVPMEKNYVVTSQEKGGASPGIFFEEERCGKKMERKRGAAQDS